MNVPERFMSVVDNLRNGKVRSEPLRDVVRSETVILYKINVSKRWENHVHENERTTVPNFQFQNN